MVCPNELQLRTTVSSCQSLSFFARWVITDVVLSLLSMFTCSSSSSYREEIVGCLIALLLFISFWGQFIYWWIGLIGNQKSPLLSSSGLSFFLSTSTLCAREYDANDSPGSTRQWQGLSWAALDREQGEWAGGRRWLSGLSFVVQPKSAHTDNRIGWLRVTPCPAPMLFSHDHRSRHSIVIICLPHRITDTCHSWKSLK